MSHYRRSKLRFKKPSFRLAAFVVLMFVVSGCSGLFGGGSKGRVELYSVLGHVSDDATRQAIEGAHVKLGSEEQTTDASGAFHFHDVRFEKGSIPLIVSAKGYTTVAKDIARPTKEMLSIDVKLTPISEPGDGQTGSDDGGDNTEPGDGEPGPQPGDGDTNPGDDKPKPGDGNTDPADGSTDPGRDDTAPGGNTDPDDNTTPGDGDSEPGDQDKDSDSGTAPPAPSYEGAVSVSVKLANAGQTRASRDVSAVSSPSLSVVRPIATVRQTASSSYVPGEWVVELDSDYPVRAISNFWSDAGVRLEQRLGDNFYVVSGDENRADEVEARLRALPNVVSVGRNRLVTPIAFNGPVIPNDEHFSKQWGLSMISAPYAWSLTTGSENVVVAVIDTGLRADHPDIDRNALAAGRNFVSGQTTTNYTDNTTHFSHGTMVTGIIGATTDNGTGVAGLNWDVTIMPIRVIGSNGDGSITSVGQGIKWAVDNGAHIINMSLAWDSVPNDAGERYVRQQIERAAAQGVIMIAGAGNDSGRITMPASHPDVIAVGAVDKNKQVAWYSNYGSQLDVVAPGGDQSRAASDGVASTDIVNGRLYYSYSEGTSFASPHVTGVVALMYSRGITDPYEIREILRDTAEDLGSPGFDPYYGFGLVNAYAAVAGLRRTDARVGIVGSDEYGVESVHPLYVGDDAVALIQGIAPGKQTVYGWIDVNDNGMLDEGDFAGMVEVFVPASGTVETELTLQIVDTMSPSEKGRMQQAVNR